MPDGTVRKVRLPLNSGYYPNGIPSALQDRLGQFGQRRTSRNPIASKTTARPGHYYPPGHHNAPLSSMPFPSGTSEHTFGPGPQPWFPGYVDIPTLNGTFRMPQKSAGYYLHGMPPGLPFNPIQFGKLNASNSPSAPKTPARPDQHYPPGHQKAPLSIPSSGRSPAPSSSLSPAPSSDLSPAPSSTLSPAPSSTTPTPPSNPVAPNGHTPPLHPPGSAKTKLNPFRKLTPPRKPNPFRRPTPPRKPTEVLYTGGALQGLAVLEALKPPGTDTAGENERDCDVHPLILEDRVRQSLMRPQRVLNGKPPTSLAQIWTYFMIKDGTGNVPALANAKPFCVSVKTNFESDRPVVTLRLTPKVPAHTISHSHMCIMANDQKPDAITTEQIHGAMTLAGNIVHSTVPSEYLRYVEIELSALVQCLRRLGVRTMILPTLDDDALRKEAGSPCGGSTWGRIEQR